MMMQVINCQFIYHVWHIYNSTALQSKSGH